MEEFRVSLVFPCDFEDKEGKRNKRYVSRFCKERKFHYSSPIISINDGKFEYLDDAMSSDEEKQAKKTANVILRSCKLLDEENQEGEELKNKFIVNNFFYPYGVCVCGTLNKSDIEVLAMLIEEKFTPFKQESVKEKKPDWIIYERPITIIEVDTISDVSSFPNELAGINLEEREDISNARFAVSNDFIIINILKNDDRFTHSLYSVLAILIALKRLSSNVRMKSKQLASGFHLNDNRRTEVVKQIHQNCAVFEEISNKNIFYKKIEQVLFERLSEQLYVKEQQKQIQSARDNVDYMWDTLINEKANRVNTTVFITGYIGLILSFFAFIPIRFQNIIMTSQPLCSWQKITLCVALVGIVIFICTGLMFLYNRWECTKSDFKSFYILLKRRNVKKLLNKIPFILSALIILALVLAIIMFGIFVLGGLFEWV